MTYGNGLIETSAYNNRLQPTQLRTHNPTTNTNVLNLSYGFTDAGANNGNVTSMTSTATQIFIRSYTYDELNRLSTMSSPADASGCTGLTWTYDAWGNRLSQNNAGGSCLTPSHAVMPNNRITDTGYNYDAAGNMTSDNVHNYTYDAENRVVAVDGGATATYTYDANGHRVQKIAGGATTEYLYDLSGNVVADVNGSNILQAAYSYLGGSLFAEYAYNLTLFIHKDHLGSTRVITDLAGAINDSMDYLPYGEQISGGSTSTHKFTGKERDAESGLDEFGARYYSAALGRFSIPDWSSIPKPIPYADLTDPQSVNLYSYLTNNPLNSTDQNGHCKICPDGLGSENKTQLDNASGKDMVGAALLGATMATAPAAVAGAGAVGVLAKNLLGLGIATAPVAVPIIVDTLEGLTPGREGTLTISSASRLTEDEVSTGVRFAQQDGTALAESSHVGEEFVDKAGKTYDAMGGAKAFENFGNGEKFLQSIDKHLRKSNDFTLIDLKGASKAQAGVINGYVKSLTKAQKAKIKFVN
jgi:RHS repeat-associated protein